MMWASKTKERNIPVNVPAALATAFKPITIDYPPFE
jgi:hypothetical protein